MHATEPPDPGAESPSRSARRRSALDVLAFAKRLSELPPARIAQLELPDAIQEELEVLRRIRSHIARKRELAHLAKLVRTHDEQGLAAARVALANDRAAGARAAAALHHVEAVREALLGADGADALTRFIAAHPHIDPQRLRALIRRSRHERDARQPPRAQRELFRTLRAIETLFDVD